VITLVLEEATPSLNTVNKMHWARRHRLRGQWQWLVKAAVLNDRIQVKVIPAARITVERYSPRKLDHDNLVGGCKQLIDSLVREGFLVDDSPAHLTANYVQHVDKTPRTIVHIEEA
jgi:Holliday junction resolvase RusA-like endonuclease